MAAIKIIIADVHLILRESLKYLLESKEGFQVVDEASDGTECLEKVLNQKPDILILELLIPGKSGFDIIKEIHQKQQKCKTVKILVLTGCRDIRNFAQAVQCGVDGYISKRSGYLTLQKAINAIVDGKSYFQPEMIEELNKRRFEIESEIKKLNSLTKREMEILKYLSVGMYNKEIALKLEISERTVKNHVSNVFKKIKVADRTQAAVFAIRNCLVDVYK